jgi:acyl carrier protein
VAIIDRLEQFVREVGQVEPDDPDFTRDTDLWDMGYLDSNGVVELIVFIESEWGVEVPEEALFDPEFTRLSGIAAVVEDLVAVARPA